MSYNIHVRVHKYMYIDILLLNTNTSKGNLLEHANISRHMCRTVRHWVYSFGNKCIRNTSAACRKNSISFSSLTSQG